MARSEKTTTGELENIFSLESEADSFFEDFKHIFSVDQIREVYKKNNYHPLWLSDEKTEKNAEIIKEHIATCYRDGLQRKTMG